MSTAALSATTTAEQISLPEKLGRPGYLRLVNECRRLAGDIRKHLSDALESYHSLGRTVLEANLHGDQMENLAKHLGSGFSKSTLYRCRQFAREYPRLEVFKEHHGSPSWREVTRIIVRKKDLHACKTTSAHYDGPSKTTFESFPATCPNCVRRILVTLDYRNRIMNLSTIQSRHLEN